MIPQYDFPNFIIWHHMLLFTLLSNFLQQSKSCFIVLCHYSSGCSVRKYLLWSCHLSSMSTDYIFTWIYWLLCGFPCFVGNSQQLFLLLQAAQIAVVSLHKEKLCNCSASKIMFQTNKDTLSYTLSKKGTVQKLSLGCYSFKRY